MGRIYKRTQEEGVPRDPADRTPSQIVPTCDCFVEKGMRFDRELGLWQCSKCQAYEDHSGKTPHQQRIEEFMIAVGHQVSDAPTIPPLEVRVFRARIMLEEMLELIIDGLGLFPRSNSTGELIGSSKQGFTFFEHRDGPNLAEIADGAVDVSVTTIGTLSACGIPDKPILEAVDENNLSKIKPRCPSCGERMRKLGLEGSIGYEGFSLPADAKRDQGHVAWSCLGCDNHYPLVVGGYVREDGKWVKGTAHRKVDIDKVINGLSQR